MRCPGETSCEVACEVACEVPCEVACEVGCEVGCAGLLCGWVAQAGCMPRTTAVPLHRTTTLCRSVCQRRRQAVGGGGRQWAVARRVVCWVAGVPSVPSHQLGGLAGGGGAGRHHHHSFLGARGADSAIFWGPARRWSVLGFAAPGFGSVCSENR